MMTENISASACELKKNIGKVVIQLNEDIVSLQRIKRKRNASGNKTLEEKHTHLETKIKDTRDGLKTTLEQLEAQPSYVTAEKLDKLVKLMKNSIETVEILIGSDTQDTMKWWKNRSSKYKNRLK